MSLRDVSGDAALPSAARAAGTHVSGSIANPGRAAHVLLLVHVTAASGTGPTLNVSLEQSNDGTTWAAVPGSGTSQLAAAGNTQGNAAVTDDYVRVTATVGGTTPSFTFTAAVLLFSE